MHLIPRAPPEMSDMCVCMCVCVCVFLLSIACVTTSPKKTSKQEKRKNMQQKYLRLEACSLKIHHVFLWADLGLRKKGGKKRKEKIQKRLLAKTKKKKKKKKKKNTKKRKEERAKRTNQQEFMVGLSFCFGFFFSWYFFFPLKRVQKQKTKGITDTDLSQEKTQDQRKLFFWMWFPSLPLQKKMAAIVYGPLFLSLSLSLYLSLSLKPCSFPEPNFVFGNWLAGLVGWLFGWLVGWVGGGWRVLVKRWKKGK